MNVQRRIITAAAGAAAIGLLSAGSAQAFTFTTDDYIVGDGTTVEFGFLESYGGFKANFGIYNVDDNTYTTLFKETDNFKRPGGNGNGLDNYGDASIIETLQSTFTFEAGKSYTFFHEGRMADDKNPITVFSTTSHNQDKSWVEFGQQAKFFNDLSILDDESYKYLNPPTGLNDSTQSDLAFAEGTSAALSGDTLSLIAFEDNGILDPRSGSTKGFHRDFNDFLVSARVVDDGGVSVPEPATVIGLGMVASGMVLSRRRKAESKGS